MADLTLSDSDVERIASAIAVKLAGAPGARETAPTVERLLDKQGIAAALGVSPAQIDRFDRAGQPHVRVGDCKRYRASAVVAWHEGRREGRRE